MEKAGIGTICVLLAVLIGFEFLKFTKVDEVAYKSIYEYRIVYVPDAKVEGDLKDIGNESWELVNARRARDAEDKWGYECILKRSRLVRQD
jgi:hypothetical protein